MSNAGMSKSRLDHEDIGRTRDDSVRPCPECHPEATTKELYQGGEARAHKYLRETRHELAEGLDIAWMPSQAVRVRVV